MHHVVALNSEPAIQALRERLISELRDNRIVLWLVSGGSNIEASVAIMRGIPKELSSRLTVMLVDERYGPVDHPDSNWHQLEAADFQGKQARLIPVLQAGETLLETTERYNQQLQQAFDEADVVIAQLGIGADGHIAGILPHSDAVSDTTDFVVAYQSDPYQRITMTFAALRQVDSAYVLAYGDEKLQPLTDLQNDALSLAEHPAQILKEISEVYVYNDQVGGTT